MTPFFLYIKDTQQERSNGAIFMKKQKNNELAFPMEMNKKRKQLNVCFFSKKKKKIKEAKKGKKRKMLYKERKAFVASFLISHLFSLFLAKGIINQGF